MKFKFNEGDEVKALATDGYSGIFKDERYVVQFAYDDVPELTEPLYSLSHRSGSSGMEGLESQLELTRTRQELAARQLPSREAIVRGMPVGWGYHEGFDINESDASPASNEIEFYGQTEAGLRFGVRLEVVDIWETDM